MDCPANVSGMTVDPSVPRLFAGTAYGLYRSGDGGHSWLPAGDTPPVTVYAVLFNSADSTVMMATEEGLFRAPSPALAHEEASRRTGERHRRNLGHRRRSAAAFRRLCREQRRIAPAPLRSRDAGVSWQQMTGPFASGVRVGVDAAGDAWFGGEFPDPNLYRIANGRDEIVPVRQFGRINAVAGSPTQPGRVYVSNGLLWRTNDGGATWTKCSETASSVSEIALNPKGPDLVYAGSFNSLWRSTDACATFQPLVSDPGNNYVLHVASAPSNRPCSTAPAAIRRAPSAATTAARPGRRCPLRLCGIRRRSPSIRTILTASGWHFSTPASAIRPTAV